MRLSSGTAIIDRAPSPRKAARSTRSAGPFFTEAFSQRPCFSLSALAASTFSERKSRVERAFFRLSIQRRAFRACVRSETPRYILVFPLSPARVRVPNVDSHFRELACDESQASWLISES